MSVEIKLMDGPFKGKTLTREDGTAPEGTLLHFDGFSYKVEWDNVDWKWVGWTVGAGDPL